MSFELDINRFVNKTKRKADSAVTKIVLSVGKSLMLKSPVGKPWTWKHPESAPPGYSGGHFLTNWQLNEGTIPTGEISGTEKNTSVVLSRERGKLGTQPAGKVWYWGNTLPYAWPLENGHSKQSPFGMVSLTQREFSTFIRNSLRGDV